MRRAAIILCLAACATSARAAIYYVAPGGSDANAGTVDAPFATFSKAVGLTLPGDTIYARGGTYNLSSNLSISGGRSGNAANPVNFFAYPGETPILDFRGQAYNASNSGQKGITLNASYWHVRGLTIQYAADNGMAIGGSNNIVEQVVARQNQDSGFIISGNMPSNNLILNCDSYGNYDFGAGGENADGFAVKFRGLGPGNVISGVRAYNNSDDGFDFWQAENGVTVINSWAFNNGIASAFNVTSGFQGDGNGIKLGHDSGTHVIQNMLVFGNPANGVDVNGNATQLESNPPTIAHGVQIYNVTAASNGSKNFQFDENPTLANPPTQHILRNNISFSGSVTVVAGNTADHNTFNGPSGSPAGLGVTAADFVSTTIPITSNGNYHPAGTGGDRSGVTTPTHATGPALAPRQLDGSLPLIDYLRLKPTSHLIAAGVDVGIPFNGVAPDVGAIGALRLLPADFDRDGAVGALDLGTWIANIGTGTMRAQGDADADGDIDGADVLAWQVLLNSASTSSIDVASAPEPAASILVVVAGSVVAARRRHLRV